MRVKQKYKRNMEPTAETHSHIAHTKKSIDIETKAC